MKLAKRSEASIQKAVVDYARKKGVIAIKQHSPGFGSAGWPDYLFIPWPPARPYMLEFKSEGGRLTELQKERHNQLDGRIAVFVVDNVPSGKSIVDGWP
jgi:hypothetical protein